ncbi:MAG: methylated-DNA--[protein]-cysteine S-methyltransferase [Myxococcales bacterium]|nr:methylated-DNA--[protein]-cysteine S-methyltransferase [Myxococcales bacterium]
METASIDYRVRACSLGQLLVAGTSRGVCYVRFGAQDDELRGRLEDEFPYARFCEVADGDVKRWSDLVAAYVDGATTRVDVPLDVRGSAFQRRVWRALGDIPRGETRSYSEVALALGNPRAARAVARACATNPVVVVTPCHRVVARAGGLGGYSGGVARKRALLRTEGVVEFREPGGADCASAEATPARETRVARANVPNAAG